MMKAIRSSNRKLYLSLVLLIVNVSFHGNCVASPAGGTDVNERLNDIANRVGAIDVKLSSLTSGQDQNSLLNSIDQRLESIDQKLDVLTGQGGTGVAPAVTPAQSSGEQETSESVQLVQQEQDEYPYFNCVNVISVERNPTSEGNRFTVKFTKNAEEIYFRYHDDTGPEKIPDSVEEQDGGVWSVSFTCGDTDQYQTSPWFVVGDRVNEEGWAFLNTRHMVSLKLNNSGSDPMFQTMGAIPELHVDPPRAAFYQPGQDINVTVFVDLENITQHDERPYLFESVYGINMTSGRAYMDMERAKILHSMRRESTREKESRTLTISTSSTTVSGYLSFGFGQNREGYLVQSVQGHRIIPLRPANQTSLPSGYLGLLDRPRNGESKNGNELQRCSAGVECDLYCFAIGETITDMNVVKVLPDGSKESVPSARQPQLSMDMNTFRAVYWKFSARTDSGDSDGLTTFQCSVTDNTCGLVVTKLVDVLVMLEDGIDEERSNVTVRDGYMDPYIKHLTFNCAVYGRPLPEVTFSGGTSYIFSMDSSEPDSVVSTGENQAVATKNITISIDYLQEYNYELHPDDILPYCGFYSRSQQEYVEYTFDVPDLGL